MEQPAQVRLETPRLVVVMPRSDDAELVRRYHYENREHLRPWEPPRPPGFFTPEFWQWRLEQNLDEFSRDQSLRLVLLPREAEPTSIFGQINFSRFNRGPSQSCLLGYSLDQHHQGKGYMTEALGAAIDFVFDRLGFHRVEANYMPTNERSGRLLRRLGFAVEGYARDYLFINNAWRDHVLTARTNPDAPRPGVLANQAPPPG